MRLIINPSSFHENKRVDTNEQLLAWNKELGNIISLMLLLTFSHSVVSDSL